MTISFTFHENTKGQLISKCIFCVFNSFQKTNENKSTWGIIVVKSNPFVRFLEEFTAWQFAFEFYWPLICNSIHFCWWTKDSIIIFMLPIFINQHLEEQKILWHEMSMKIKQQNNHWTIGSSIISCIIYSTHPKPHNNTYFNAIIAQFDIEFCSEQQCFKIG